MKKFHKGVQQLPRGERTRIARMKNPLDQINAITKAYFGRRSKSIARNFFRRSPLNRVLAQPNAEYTPVPGVFISEPFRYDGYDG